MCSLVTGLKMSQCLWHWSHFLHIIRNLEPWLAYNTMLFEPYLQTPFPLGVVWRFLHALPRGCSRLIPSPSTSAMTWTNLLCIKIFILQCPHLLFLPGLPHTGFLEGAMSSTTATILSFNTMLGDFLVSQKKKMLDTRADTGHQLECHPQPIQDINSSVFLPWYMSNLKHLKLCQFLNHQFEVPLKQGGHLLGRILLYEKRPVGSPFAVWCLWPPIFSTILAMMVSHSSWLLVAGNYNRMGTSTTKLVRLSKIILAPLPRLLNELYVKTTKVWSGSGGALSSQLGSRKTNGILRLSLLLRTLWTHITRWSTSLGIRPNLGGTTPALEVNPSEPLWNVRGNIVRACEILSLMLRLPFRYFVTLFLPPSRLSR